MKSKILKGAFGLKKMGILILVNLVISILITILIEPSNQVGKFKLFQIDWIYSNCIGFSIYFSIHLLDSVKLRNWLKVVSVFMVILLASIWGGVLGTRIVSYLYGYQISFFKSVNLTFFLSISLIFGISAYGLFTLLGRIHTRKIQWLEEKQARTQAELISLRTRINPHFLFNTLNSISGLIHIYPDKADNMLQQLSELLRYTLNAADISEIDLNCEIEVIHDYLEIEKIRFGERLDFSISNKVDNFKFPPLLLLTLVENAIKHGISTALEGGRVEVRIGNISGSTVLSVFNTGNSLPEQHETGFGLNTLTKLLNIHYQGKARFRLISFETGTLAEIVISILS
ncbi:MAG: histidine kinase [Candidatus Cloacimonetes bacterium]|nr:histidine kinase [Candidatus Cloacimonadota bacterium]